MIFSSLISWTELAIWHEKVDVIGTDKVLSHVNDGHCKGHLAMMIGRMFSYVTCKLCYFNLLFKITFEASENDLSLARFKAVNDGGYWAIVVFVWKMDELLIHELFVSYLRPIINHNCIRIISTEPFFTFLYILPTEYELDCFIIFLSCIAESYFILIDSLKVFLSFFICGCSQSFVVFYLPSLYILNSLSPVSIVSYSIKGNYLSSFWSL